jgi:hypothetical protein
MTDQMAMNSFTYNVLYVDSSLVSGGDGQSPATALSSPVIGTSAMSVSGFSTGTVYLFRRNSVPTFVYPTINTNANVVLMGMPQSTSYLNSLLPAAASAWSDTGEAIVQLVPNSSSSTGLTLNGANCSTIGLKVLGASLVNYSSGILAFNNFYPTLSSCTVGISGVSLSGSDAVASSVSCLGVSVSGRGLSMDKCYIYGHNSTAVQVAGTSFGHDFTNINGNTFYLRRYSNFTTINGLTFQNSFAYGAIKNNRFIVNENSLSGTSSNGTIISMGSALGYIDITDTLIDVINDTSSSTPQLVGLALTETTFNNLSYGEIKVSRFTLNATSTVRTVRGAVFTGCKKLTFDNITVNALATTSSSSVGVSVNNCKNYKASSLNLNVGSAATGCAAFSEDTQCERSCVSDSWLFSSGLAFNGSRADIVNCSGGGAIVGGGDSMHFVSLARGASTQAPFITLSNVSSSSISPILYIQTLNAAGQASGPNLTSNGLLIIDSLSGAPAGTMLLPCDYSKIYINNEQIPNLWHHETPYNKMFSSLTNRSTGPGITGAGTGFSIRCEGKSPDSSNVNSNGNLTYNAMRAAVIAPRPYDGRAISFGTTGNKRLTFFIANRLLGSLNGSNCWIEAIVPDGATGTQTKVISTTTHPTYITDSSSTWVNDSSLTMQKIVLEFNLDRAETVYWRFFFHDYVGGLGYLYFDPTPYIQSF